MAVPSLSIFVVITQIGGRARVMNPDVAAALVGALLSGGRARADSHTGAAWAG